MEPEFSNEIKSWLEKCPDVYGFISTMALRTWLNTKTPCYNCEELFLIKNLRYLDKYLLCKGCWENETDFKWPETFSLSSAIPVNGVVKEGDMIVGYVSNFYPKDTCYVGLRQLKENERLTNITPHFLSFDYNLSNIF